MRYGSWTGSDTPGTYGLLAVLLVFFILAFFGFGEILIGLLAWPPSPEWLRTVQPWRPLTFPLVHGIGFGIVWDGLVLFFFGGSLERAWGTARFLAFFFLSGIVAGVAVLVFSLFNPNLQVVFVGMVGSFVALVVAFAALNPSASVIFLIFPMEARWLGVIAVAFELFFNSGRYGGPLPALAAVGLTTLFAWAVARGRTTWRPRGGGGPGLRDRFERWRQRQRMRAWQKKVSKVDKPEDLFK